MSTKTKEDAPIPHPDKSGSPLGASSMEEIQLKYELESILGQQPGLKILNSMGFSIAILDTDLRIVWANREYHEV